LIKSITFLLGNNAASYLILFLISIIIFRSVDKSFYGLYVVMLSLFAVIELLMTGFNDVIVRFLKDKIPLSDKQSIVFFVLFYKYFLILLFILLSYITRQYGFFEYLIGNYNEVSALLNSFLMVVIINGIFSTLISVNNCILNSQLEYKYTANVGLIRNLLYLLVVTTLSFYTNEYLYYLYSSILLSFGLLLCLSIKIFNDFNEFSILNIIKSKFSIDIGKKYIFPYAAPLSISSLLTYVKNYLPTIILGKEFSLIDVAVFSIIKTFYKSLHSLSSSFVDPMMSKFLEYKISSDGFAKKMMTIFYGTFFLRLVLLILLTLISQYFFILYKLESNEINRLIFNILGIEFVLAGVMISYGLVLKLDKNTNKLFFIGLIRFSIELLLIYLILIDYGILAAALILLLARYVETVTGYFIIRSRNIFNYTGLVIAIFIIPIGLFLYKIFSV
jgi:O-antigen/teichoic acid export membrane protein